MELRNYQAELSLLGTAMYSADCARSLADLPADFFTAPDLQAAHRAVGRLVARGEQIDLVTLDAEIAKEDTPCPVVLVQAAEAGNKPSFYGQWCAILDDLRQRRAVAMAAQEALTRAQDPSVSPEALRAALADGAKVADTSPTTVTMGMALCMLFQSWRDTGKGCYTGVADIDRLIGGFRGGKLVVLGARPGVGKTALALSIARHVASHTGAVLIVSLEMSPEEIASRMYAAVTGIDVAELDTGRLSEASLDKQGAYGGDVSRLPIRVSDRACTPMQIRREAQRMQERDGLAMVVVDYIQLMRPDSKHGSRYEDVSDISRELKLLAMDLGVPVLALTQFNRDSEAGKNGQRVKRAPSMAEAKDSGSIEQDANVFIIQWEPDEPGDEPTACQVAQICQAQGWAHQQLIVAKNRQGRTGVCNIAFDKPHMTFHSFDIGGR